MPKNCADIYNKELNRFSIQLSAIYSPSFLISTMFVQLLIHISSVPSAAVSRRHNATAVQSVVVTLVATVGSPIEVLATACFNRSDSQHKFTEHNRCLCSTIQKVRILVESSNAPRCERQYIIAPLF